MGLFDFLKKKEPVTTESTQPSSAPVNPVSTFPVNFDDQTASTTTVQPPTPVTPTQNIDTAPLVDATQTVGNPVVTQAPTSEPQPAVDVMTQSPMTPQVPVNDMGQQQVQSAPVAPTSVLPQDTEISNTQQFSDSPIPPANDPVAGTTNTMNDLGSSNPLVNSSTTMSMDPAQSVSNTSTMSDVSASAPQVDDSVPVSVDPTLSSVSLNTNAVAVDNTLPEMPSSDPDPVATSPGYPSASNNFSTSSPVGTSDMSSTMSAPSPVDESMVNTSTTSTDMATPPPSPYVEVEQPMGQVPPLNQVGMMDSPSMTAGAPQTPEMTPVNEQPSPTLGS